jgi:hypothetical protein
MICYEYLKINPYTGYILEEIYPLGQHCKWVINGCKGDQMSRIGRFTKYTRRTLLACQGIECAQCMGKTCQVTSFWASVPNLDPRPKKKSACIGFHDLSCEKGCPGSFKALTV